MAVPLPLNERIARLWRPAGLPSNGAALALYRAWAVTLPFSIVFLLVVPLDLGLSLLFRRALLPGHVVAALVGLGLLPSILRQSLKILLAFLRGAFTRKGIPVRRVEEPGRYWFWMSVEGIAWAVPLAAAVYLLVAGVTPG